MKKTLVYLTLAAIISMPLAAYAADQADKRAPTEQAAPDVAKFDEQLALAQKDMKKMQEQMAALQATQDPQARQNLLQEHLATMNSMMATMRGMWGPGMMGCCGGMMGGGWGPGMMGWNNTQGYYAKLTPEQIKQRQYMMDQYVGMQQWMMDNMMYQNWEHSPTRP